MKKPLCCSNEAAVCALVQIIVTHHLQRKVNFYTPAISQQILMKFEPSPDMLQHDPHTIIDCLNNAALCCWLATPLHFLTALTALNVNGLYLIQLQGNYVKVKP